MPATSVGKRAGASGGGALAAGDTASDVLFGETLHVDCHENHRLGSYSAGCQDRGFQVRRASLAALWSCGCEMARMGRQNVGEMSDVSTANMQCVQERK